jgi:DNA-directed RNA polymerase specialized sigma24 family protein
MATTDSSEHLPASARAFATTHWSVVLAACGGESPQAGAALERLCQTYWYPLYAHVRRRGHDADQARDLTQGFFAEMLARHTIARADPNRGRLRTFLLTALDHHLHHQHRDAQALKRGGGHELVSLDAVEAEQRLALEPLELHSPDREFDRRWALATLETVRRRLREDVAVSGRAELFDELRPHLFGDLAAAPYAQMATRLNLTVVAVKVTVHRLRRRYGELLRQEVAHTVADPSEVEQEIRHLIAALGDS